MTLKINFKNTVSKKFLVNLVLFVDDKFNTNSLKKYISSSELSYIADILKTSDLNKNLLIFKLNSKKKVILVSIKKNLKTFDIENLGAELYGHINHGKNSEYFINLDNILSNHDNLIDNFLHGLKLKSYEFNKYKSKKENRTITINVIGRRNKN